MALARLIRLAPTEQGSIAIDTEALASHLEVILRELESRMPRAGGAAEVGEWGELLRYIAWVNSRIRPSRGESGPRPAAPPESGGVGPGPSSFTSVEGRRRKARELHLRAAPLTRRLPPHAYVRQGHQLMELVRITGSADEGIEVQRSLHLLVRDLDSRHRRLGHPGPDQALLLTLLREFAVLTWVEARRAAESKSTE